MTALTKIDWCERTFNPTTGYAPISHDCANCYEQNLAYGRAAKGQPKNENESEATPNKEG